VASASNLVVFAAIIPLVTVKTGSPSGKPNSSASSPTTTLLNGSISRAFLDCAATDHSSAIWVSRRCWQEIYGEVYMLTNQSFGERENTAQFSNPD
jgi:hypothetical protein